MRMNNAVIDSKTKISEKLIHLGLGLIDLSLREVFTTISSSSSTTSFAFSFLPSFLSPFLSSLISPLTSSLISSLSPRYNRFDKIYDHFDKSYKGLSYINTSKSDVRDTIKDSAVDFLIKLRLLSLFIFIVFLKRLSLI